MGFLPEGPESGKNQPSGLGPTVWCKSRGAVTSPYYSLVEEWEFLMRILSCLKKQKLADTQFCC